MEVRDELLTIGEIAIGIAGFSGVIAAFLQHGGLHPVDRVRFVNLFTAAFSTLFLAFVPIAISHLTAESDRLWISSSLVMTLVWLFNLAVSARAIPQIRRHLSVNPTLPRALVGVPAIMNLGVQILNAGGWLWEPGFLAYLFGLFVYIYSAGLMFVFVILYRPDSESAA